MSALVLFRLPLVRKETHSALFLGALHSKISLAFSWMIAILVTSLFISRSLIQTKSNLSIFSWIAPLCFAEVIFVTPLAAWVFLMISFLAKIVHNVDLFKPYCLATSAAFCPLSTLAIISCFVFMVRAVRDTPFSLGPITLSDFQLFL